MRILSLTNEFEDESFGGAGTAVTGIVHMLDSVGVQQTVIVPRSDWNRPGWASLGRQIKVLWLPRNSHYFGYLGMIKTEVVCQEFPEICHGWDIIHTHAINFIPLAYTLSQGAVPILYSVYSLLRKELGDSSEPELQAQFKIQEELFMRCRRIHVISRNEKQHLTRRFPQYLSKTDILPLGVTIPHERWQKGSQNQFLYVGRLLDYKGIEDLLNAVAMTNKSGKQIHLNIVGKGNESYVGYLKQLVQSLKLVEYSHFHGKISNFEVRKWMAGSTALVIPSLREAYGLVALEGMAIGTPVIASNAGGLAEVALNTCALTFEAGHVDQLAMALTNLNFNPILQQSLSIKGHENALRFEWSRLAPSYVSLLERVRAQG